MAVFYAAYSARNAARADPAIALAHARTVLRLERSFGIAHELG
jgi:hypothetical protein